MKIREIRMLQLLMRIKRIYFYIAITGRPFNNKHFRYPVLGERSAGLRGKYSYKFALDPQLLRLIPNVGDPVALDAS